MKKTLILGMALVAVTALTVAPVSACDQGASGTSAQMTSAHAGCAAACAGMKQASAKMTDAKACPAGQMSIEECAKVMGMTPEQCQKLCADGKMTMVNMNIKGMTCGSCEKTVTAALEKTPGVVKVISVDHKSGTALAVIDPSKTKPETLAKVVTDKGYESEVIPAVAKTVAPGEASTTMDHSKCTAAQKAACAAKEAKTTEASVTDTK